MNKVRLVHMISTARFALLDRGRSAGAFEREDGQTLAEYALILAGIAVVVVVAVAFLGSTISGIYSTIGSAI